MEDNGGSPLPDAAELEFYWSSIPEEHQVDVSKKVCETCNALLNLRDTFERLIKAHTDPGLRNSFQVTLSHVEMLIDRCIEVQMITGDCPHPQ